MKRLAGATLLMALGASCGAPKPKLVDFSETARDYRAKDYQVVYERWTRHDWALHEVDAALEVWATFKSWDFREAYIERYASIYNLPDTERHELRQAQLEAFHKHFEFHVTAQSANYKWNDLEKKDSAWRVTLVDGLGNELSPEYVRVVKIPDAYEREFFPAKTPFTKTYSIRFLAPGAAAPSVEMHDGGASGGGASRVEFRGPKTGSITLRIASPLGRVELIWQSG